MGALVWTAHHWQHWLDRGQFPDHPWRSYLQRSALTLKGLSYAPTGALVAAATTSLPETPGGERNWDYRYTWIRDATFMLWGLYTLGFDWEANDFFYFLADVAEAERGNLQIMYGIGGERELPERTLDHLSGYEGARPVRIGNDAYKQPQHDVWGAILDSFYLHTKSRDQLPERMWPILVKQVEARARRSGASPTAASGRCAASRSTSRRRSSCAGSRPTAARGSRRSASDLECAARWQSAAEEIKADICANALDERGVFCQHYDTTALDASRAADAARALPPRRRRAHPKPRCWRSPTSCTVEGLVMRYRTSGDRRRARRAGGDVHDLLVLARVGIRRDRRGGESARSSARSCSPMRARCSSTPRRSTRTPDATWATSRRRSRTSR